MERQPVCVEKECGADTELAGDSPAAGAASNEHRRQVQRFVRRIILDFPK